MLKGHRPDRGQGQYGPSAEAPIDTDNAKQAAKDMTRKVLANAGIDEAEVTARWKEGGKVFDVLDTVSVRADIVGQMVAAQQQMQQTQEQAVVVQQPIQQAPPAVQVSPIAYEYQQVQQPPVVVQQQVQPFVQPAIPRDGLSMETGPRVVGVTHEVPTSRKGTIFSKATNRIAGKGAGRFGGKPTR